MNKATPIHVNSKSNATNTKPIMPALAKGKGDIKKGLSMISGTSMWTKSYSIMVNYNPVLNVDNLLI